MIVQTVDLPAFRQAFRDYNRTDNFSHEGLEALHEYLEELSEDIGEPVELDVIGICCDFAEYDSAEECALEYGWDKPEQDIDEEDPEFSETEEDYEERCEEEAKEWLRDRTTVLELSDGGVVIQQF